MMLMEAKVISKEDINRLVQKYLDQYQVFAPVMKDDGKVQFERVNASEEMTLEYGNTLRPPKNVMLPQTETMFEFCTSPEVKLTPHAEEEKGRMIIGIRPCDARALTLIDKTFIEDEKYVDTYYAEKRKNGVIIGLACNTPPSYNCFCTSLGGSPASSEGMDILLTDLGERYYVEPITEKGAEIIENSSDLFSNATDGDKNASDTLHKEAEKLIKRHLDVEGIPEKLDKIFESPYWDKVARKCLGCGACTYLCPTCYCFDMTDERIGNTGRRVRTWEPCMFSEYTVHASGHNPRPERKNRLRNRIYHKYKYLMDNAGVIGCVGCGRCIDACPQGVDIIKIISDVRGVEE